MSRETPLPPPERTIRIDKPAKHDPDATGIMQNKARNAPESTWRLEEAQRNAPDVTAKMPSRTRGRPSVKKEYNPLTDEDREFLYGENNKALEERLRFEEATVSREAYRKRLAEARAEFLRSTTLEPLEDFPVVTERAHQEALLQQETEIVIPPYWSFDDDQGKAAYEYLLAHSAMDEEQKEQVRRKLEAGERIDLQGDIQSHVVSEHPTERSLKRELERSGETDLKHVLEERIQKNEQAYDDLVSTIKFYQSDIALPTYQEAIVHPEKTIEVAAKDFGIDVDFENEAQDPLIVELWDRYQGIVHDGQVLERVAQEIA